jgi:hypothetical protein
MSNGMEVLPYIHRLHFLEFFFACLSLLDIVVSVVICNHLSLCCKLMTYQHIWWILDVSDACLAVVAFQGY